MRAHKQDVNSVKTSTRKKANVMLDKRCSALRFLIYYSFVIKIESPLTAILNPVGNFHIKTS